MVEIAQLDPSDRTPLKVLDGMLMAHKPYKHDDCIPCGAVIKIGFLFDAFGRSRDHDDPSTSRYSNICRSWEAHRENVDSRRKDMPNQFWYRFYYSGLGTELNQDAANNEIVSAMAKTAVAVGKSAVDSAKSTAQKVVGVGRLFGTGVEDRLHAALKQFEAAYRDAKAKMNKVQHIEVSVFGADRGGVLARAFINELVSRSETAGSRRAPRSTRGRPAENGRRASGDEFLNVAAADNPRH